MSGRAGHREGEVAARIGIVFRRPWAALLAAAGFVLLDMGACYWRLVSPWQRSLLAGAGAAVIAGAAGFDRQALGLVFRPIQGYRY